MCIPTKLNLEKSLRVIELDHEVFTKVASLKYYPLAVNSAKGSRLTDFDGNEYIDFVSGAAVFNIGHLHEDIVATIRKQLEKLIAYPQVYFYVEEPCALAKKLIEITPGSFKKKVIFGFSGSDAVDMALTIARAYTGRKHILSFTGSYHGATYFSMSVSGIWKEEVRRHFQLLKEVLFAVYPNPYRNPWGIDGYEDPKSLTNLALDSVEKLIKDVGGDVAAIIVEPIQADGGIVVPPDDFMRGLARLSYEYGSVLVVDEIKTGVGRTGRWWAVEHFGIEPDVIVAGKALGGGMPISAVVGRADIFDGIPVYGTMGFTLSGHSVSAVAALKTIEVIEKEKLIERANIVGNNIYRILVELKEKSNIVGDVRGKGMLIGVEIVRNKKDKTPDKPSAQKIVWRSWEKGVVLMTVGTHGNVLRIAPPLNIRNEEVEKAVQVIESSVSEVEKGMVADEVLKYMVGW
ncbi:MAG: aspartate aminotransferase family protein [Thermosphaera sp.]